MSINDTPRLSAHIAIFGRRNAGIQPDKRYTGQA